MSDQPGNLWNHKIFLCLQIGHSIFDPYFKIIITAYNRYHHDQELNTITAVMLFYLSRLVDVIELDAAT